MASTDTGGFSASYSDDVERTMSDSDYKLVEKATLFPSICAISGSHVGPFLDLRRNMGDHCEPGARWYIRELYAEEIGKAIGMLPKAQAEEKDMILQLQADRIRELEAELEEAQRENAAIDILESKGFTARKKPGRPPKKEKTVA